MIKGRGGDGFNEWMGFSRRKAQEQGVELPNDTEAKGSGGVTNVYDV